MTKKLPLLLCSLLCLAQSIFFIPATAQAVDESQQIEEVDSAVLDWKIDSVETYSEAENLEEDAPIKPDTEVSLIGVGRAILGVIFLLFVCWAFSSNRRLINWKLVGTGIAMQIILALMILKIPLVKNIFAYIARGFVSVLEFAKAGASFLFGPTLVNDPGFGAIFAFQILPTIIFFSALTSILYYLGILQRIVYAFAWLMNRTMQLSGAESLAAAANIFVGQTEAPLVVKPYLERMSKSEILCLMTGGMATIAGGVLAAYIGFLGGDDPIGREIFATHLLTASIMSAPAAIIAAKMLFPETDPAALDRSITVPKDKIGSNFLDAISVGTTDGLRLAINVGAMLLTFIALIFGVNFILGLFGDWFNINQDIFASTGGRFDKLSLDYIFGLVFAPIAWILGTPWNDAMLVGQLLGKKTIINEFVAYESMHQVISQDLFASNKSIIIATYALCGFSNFSSIGIQIGGIGALAPGQRKTLAAFGIKALIGGTIACFLTATIAGALF